MSNMQIRLNLITNLCKTELCQVAAHVPDSDLHLD